MSSDAQLILADIASGQWGLVTTPQAVEAGLTRVQLSRLCKVGTLVRLSHGVYVLRGAIGTPNIELLAAWLALDPSRLASDRLDDGPAGAVVSHASAAALFDLGDLDADHYEFTVSGRKQTRRQDMRLHRGSLTAEEVTLRGGLPVTTPLRTVVDLLVDGHDGGHVAGVLADALRMKLIDRSELTELGERIGPYAARFGLRRGDGHALLRHLQELGGVAEQVDADEVAAAARAARVPVSELLAAIGDARSAALVSSAPKIEVPELLSLNKLVSDALAAAAPKINVAGLLAQNKIISESLTAANRGIDVPELAGLNDVARNALAAAIPKINVTELLGLNKIVSDALAIAVPKIDLMQIESSTGAARQVLGNNALRGIPDSTEFPPFATGAPTAASALQQPAEPEGVAPSTHGRERELEDGEPGRNGLEDRQ